MSLDRVGVLCVFAFAALLSACSGKSEYGKQTFPVTGEVYVDGSPAAKASVTLHPVDGTDPEVPTVSAAFTNDDGTFAVSTFEEADGVPAGEYVATITWGEYNMMARSMGPDKLKGRYADPEKSEIKVTVAPGEPTSMGRLELTTK